VGRGFPVAVCVESRIVIFVIIASGVDVTVGEVLSEACDRFFEIFVRRVWWMRTEGKSQSE